MTLSGKVSLKVKMTILIIEILIIGLYGVVVGAKNMGTIRNDAITSMEEYVSEEHPEYSGSMSILWAQKVELFSQHNICRENYFLGC